MFLCIWKKTEESSFKDIAFLINANFIRLPFPLITTMNRIQDGEGWETWLLWRERILSVFDENFPLCLKKSGEESSVESFFIHQCLPYLCNSDEIRLFFGWGVKQRSPRHTLTSLISRSVTYTSLNFMVWASQYWRRGCFDRRHLVDTTLCAKALDLWSEDYETNH